MRMRMIGVLMVLAWVANAQDPGPGYGRGRGPFGGGPNPAFQGPGARLLGAEAGMPGRVVKNAPYSADLVTETTQTLPDGNRIHQTSTSHAYRDSEGRTRREPSLNSLNSLAPNSHLPAVIFINDPVAGLNYALSAKDHTATRSSGMRPGGRANQAKSAGGPPPGGRDRFNQNMKVEALGRQTVEGVPADGTRTTITIPAGQIGNEQPIQIVTESWYSPDLQAVVMSKRSDPRTGESSFHMGNLSRGEPAAALFQVPTDYKIAESTRPPRNGPGTGR
jgi:hypothetical protein